MGKLRSEILFNRALLWLVLSQTVSDEFKFIGVIDVVCAVFNLWKSYKVWEPDE